jgi:hypothetical protein
LSISDLARAQALQYWITRNLEPADRLAFGKQERDMAQKSAGGNPGGTANKGGDSGAQGGRGGGGKGGSGNGGGSGKGKSGNK